MTDAKPPLCSQSPEEITDAEWAEANMHAEALITTLNMNGASPAVACCAISILTARVALSIGVRRDFSSPEACEAQAADIARVGLTNILTILAGKGQSYVDEFTQMAIAHRAELEATGQVN